VIVSIFGFFSSGIFCTTDIERIPSLKDTSLISQSSAIANDLTKDLLAISPTILE
jgi:hypothetical protein